MQSMENAYIDACSNCTVFIGPSRSTCFIRNCRNIRVRAISQQLRIENSENVEVEGVVGVRPVLEGCRHVSFYALGCKIYDDLIWQIEKAKIDIFDNQIYECYDFTPRKHPNFSNGEKEKNFETDMEW
jgi:protein XRP2